MKEICVIVRIPGYEEKNYRFGSSSLLVGRSIECNLSICHESVPRELCTVWLESDGKIVRVEERPGLTNRLFHGVHPVEGGVSGRRLELSVGPVDMVFYSGHGLRFESSNKKTEISKLLVSLVCISLLLVCGSFIFFKNGTSEQATKIGMSLPDSPFADDDSVLRTHNFANSLEQGKLLRSRALEILSRRDSSKKPKIMAARLLGEAAVLMKNGGDVRGASGANAKEKELKYKLECEYKKQVLLLRRFLGRGEKSEAARCAHGLLEFFDEGDEEIVGWLEEIVAQEKGGM